MGQTVDRTDSLQQQVVRAAADGTPLRIVGGDSKPFYGRPVDAPVLHVGGHCGVVHYEPTELVLTARTGTTLDEIEALLAEHGQMLPFEPPHRGRGATLGGTVACNFSGPRRLYAGSVRDVVLGCRTINGRGELLRFGGEVMKNVAGYDASRLMTGALGTLGVLLEISLKVLPVPQQELTLVQPCPISEVLERMNHLSGQPLPLSALAWVDDALYLRFSGAEAAIASVQSQLDGDVLAEGKTFWRNLREHEMPFFSNTDHLWRIALPQAVPLPQLPGEWLLEWGGAQRWLKSDVPADQVRTEVAARGGHATLFHDDSAEFHPLTDGLWQLHRRLKSAFDPAATLNPGRMYEGL